MNLLNKIPNKGLKTSITDKVELEEDIETIYDVKINDLQGKVIDLSIYKGKYILFVNVASKCGFTGQYDALQSLYDTYGSNLEVIGVPCNQFGGQEPSDALAIETFCERNYGITFTMTEKIDVKGQDQHPLYKWLTKKAYNAKKSTSVKWNFQKYLVGPSGEFIDVFYSITRPTSSRIIKHLK